MKTSTNKTDFLNEKMNENTIASSFNNNKNIVQRHVSIFLIYLKRSLMHEKKKIEKLNILFFMNAFHDDTKMMLMMTLNADRTNTNRNDNDGVR